MEVRSEGRVGAFTRFRDWLPKGQTLPDDIWLRRHRALVVLMIAQGVALAIFGAFEGYGLLHTIAHISVIAPLAYAAIAYEKHRRWAAVLVAVGLATECALLVHVWHGAIEGHFLFFVMIVVLAMYEDWLPLLVAAAYVLVHHGLVGALDPSAVYNHPDAIAHPWKWAAIHAAFVLAAGVAALIAWRENERVRAQAYREQRHAQKSEERFRRGFEGAQIGMALAALDGEKPELIQVNPALSKITGFSEAELLGRDYRTLIHASDRPESSRRLAKYLAGEVEAAQFETQLVHSDGHIVLADVSVALLAAEDGEPRLCIAQIQDVTEQRRASEKLAHQALHDELTGLNNRRSLIHDLGERIEEASEEHPVTLLLFDLDGFKSYNDTFGHPAGDALLRRVGHRLEKRIEGHGTAYRMGGDEFCVLSLNGGGDPRELIDSSRDALNMTGDAFNVSSSFGAVNLPDEAADPSDALAIADRRMYAAKRSARRSPERQSADVLLQILSERSPALGSHLDDVTQLCEAVALKMELPQGEIAPLLQAAALHDVGKAAIPDEILNKPGPLDEDEWALMRRHTLIGERILGAAPALSEAARLVRWSHERWDGDGYPDGIKGEEIPLGARVIAVCDSYDAMISDRPYRNGMSREEAIRELRRCSGTQFDPEVVDGFVDAFDSASQPATVAVR